MNLKKWKCGLFFLLLMLEVVNGNTIESKAAKRENIDLYARAAVLMDGDSGRVLYGKEEDLVLPMASTTKIMTCILALEKGDMNEQVTVSSYAVSMPKVHLGMKMGETYRLEDLLYSLMLESHNDAAVAIAEAIAGDVPHFAEMMNEKAKEIGCNHTTFITPNGLDASVKTKEGEKNHSTTASDLAKIMRYCVMKSPKREEFLRITQTPEKSFSNVEQTRTFHCVNHNAFLQMMEGMISGKTGFTGNAGYCYVGALERDGKTFIVSLLACGWPNHKTYKWKDTRKLMEYGLSHYDYQIFKPDFSLESVLVREGLAEDGNPYKERKMNACCDINRKSFRLLVRDGEKVSVQTHYEKEVDAPVENGKRIGQMRLLLEDYGGRKYEIVRGDICLEDSVDRLNYSHYFLYIVKKYVG